ncbi:MAG: hypothetical protein J1F40_07700, partial [Prevotellaceae bacterium]|nr:hypothetical protein [Prevotellaceae bacterium]
MEKGGTALMGFSVMQVTTTLPCLKKSVNNPRPMDVNSHRLFSETKIGGICITRTRTNSPSLLCYEQKRRV